MPKCPGGKIRSKGEGRGLGTGGGQGPVGSPYRSGTAGARGNAARNRQDLIDYQNRPRTVNRIVRRPKKKDTSLQDGYTIHDWPKD